LHFNEVFWFDQSTSSAKETSQQPSYDSPHVARAYGKHAFSVSGRFRQLLTDLIKTMHNSNRISHQTILEGKIIQQEYSYYVLGFVPIDVVRLKKTLGFMCWIVTKSLESKNICAIKEVYFNEW